MKTLAIILAAALALTACAKTDPAQTNRDRLAAAVSAYGVAQSGAIVYLSRPLCPTGSGITVSNICRDAGTSSTIFTIDKAATRAIDRATDALKTNQAGAAALVDAAVGQVDALGQAVPKPN